MLCDTKQHTINNKTSILCAHGWHRYKTKRLADKKSSVSLGVRVFHCITQQGHGVPDAGRETPAPGTPCLITDVPSKEVDQAGHEVRFAFSASNLLKFDWASRSDPMVALLEKVKKPKGAPGLRFADDDCGLGCGDSRMLKESRART